MLFKVIALPKSMIGPLKKNMFPYFYPENNTFEAHQNRKKILSWISLSDLNKVLYYQIFPHKIHKNQISRL